ncbi:MAG: hypothetical protein LBT02_04060 [Rickettsiales bacterium]|jgi:multicomponent Na+:H+ antiporter subunit D|nr:hypothetical protein [Rickettsiales bacterium]
MISVINLPFLFLFVPLIFSGIQAMQNLKVVNKALNLILIIFILVLAFFLFPTIINTGGLEKKINHKTFLLLGEYKIELMNLLIIIIVFSIKLFNSFFKTDEKYNTKKERYIYSIYFINYFSILGILTSNDIMNLFIYIEIFSFTSYSMLTDFTEKNVLNFGWSEYNNGLIGSLFFLLFTLILYFVFDTTNLTDIDSILLLTDKEKMTSYNLSFVILFVAIYFKFFGFINSFESFQDSKHLSSISYLNTFFINFALGFYLIQKFLPLFDLNNGYIYIFHIFGSILIIYGSVIIYKKNNILLYMQGFALIATGYIIILFTMQNNKYAGISLYSFFYNYLLIDYLYYIIIAMFVDCYKHNNIIYMNFFSKYRYIVYAIIFSKIGFPIAFGFNANWNFLLAVFEKNAFYLAIPFAVEKTVCIILLYKFNNVFTAVQDEKIETLKKDVYKEMRNLKFVYLYTFMVLIFTLAIYYVS